MKRIIYIILFVLILALLLKSCIRRDIPDADISKTNVLKTENTVNYPPPAQTVTLDGIDYLQAQTPIGKYGGELITSTIGEGPKTFNIFSSKDATSSEMSGLMYDALFSTNPQTGAVEPKLAKNYEIKNGTVYIVNLRHGLKWSDGAEITADDVIFTWNEIILKGLGNTSIKDAVTIDKKLPKVIKTGKYQVQFIITKPFAPFLRIIGAPIVPKHIFKDVVKKGAKEFDLFYSTNTPPEKFVVSGAFKLKEYVAAQRVVFERNPNYYMIDKKNQKLPYLNKLVYLIVGDLNNEILKFEAKETDIISLKGSNVARYKAKEANSDYKIYNIGSDTGTMFIVFNLNKRKNADNKFYVNPKKQMWFNDLNFRKAVDYAIDRKSMVQNIANGVAAPLFTAESLNSVYLNKDIKGHNRNMALATQLLYKSGFKYGRNQKLYDKYDNKVEFDLYTNAGNTEREALGVMIKQDLEDLGMYVNFKPIEFNSLVNKMTSTLDWDMIIMGLTGSPLEPHDGKNVWYSNGSLHLFNQRTSRDTKDDRLDFEKELDTIFDKGALETDFKKRKELYDRYQQIIYYQKPIIYLYSPTRIVAIRKKFKNIYPSPLSGVIYNIEEIYEDKN